MVNINFGLSESLDLYNKLLGKGWIEDQVNRWISEHGSNNYFYLCEEYYGHQIIRNWPIDGKIKGEVQHQNIVEPAFYIHSVKNLPGFNKRVETSYLRDPIGFKSFIYECKVAYELTRLGNNVQFFTDKKKLAPDLIICGKNNVYIECKAKVYTKLNWDFKIKCCQIVNNVLHLLDESQRNLSIEFFSTNIMEDVKIDELLLQFKEEFQKELNHGHFGINNTQIFWHTLSKYNEKICGNLNINRGNSDYGIFEGGFYVNERRQIDYFINPRLLSFNTDINFDNVSPIIRKFKDNTKQEDALRQIADYSPSMIFLEVQESLPIYDLKEVERQITETFNPSSPMYDKRTQGLKYCSLSSINSNAGDIPLNKLYNKIIENKYTKITLPDDINIPY